LTRSAVSRELDLAMLDVEKSAPAEGTTVEGRVAVEARSGRVRDVVDV